MDAMGRISFQELPDSASQNSANEDIRIQNDHRLCTLSRSAHLPEFGNDLFFIEVCQSFGQPVSRRFEFRNIGGTGFATGWDINAERLSTACYRNRSIRLQESRDSFAKFADTYLNCCH